MFVMGLFFSILWGVLLFTYYSRLVKASQTGDQVQTASGFVQGHASSWQPEVSEYLGIRYAQPPVGSWRFAYPRPFRSDGYIVAEYFSPDCPANTASMAQALGDNKNAARILSQFLQAGHRYDEDCLSLNIWTKPQTGSKLKAVLVFFYGGAFFLGSSAAPAYDGARLANENDVVVVTVNYRVNIFGFPNGPGIPDINLGLLDQRLAVEWVRDNIAGFGGDPKRITIFGESSGGTSVDLYSYAWREYDPIINGIIAQSGTASFTLQLAGTPSNNNEYTAWYAASTKLGCGGKEAGAATVDCMRQKSFQEILLAINTDVTNLLSTNFGPTPDGKMVYYNISTLSKAGQFWKVPMLVGNNDNEGGIVTVLSSGFLSYLGTRASVVTNYLSTVVGIGLTCGSRDTARARATAGVKTWRYRYFGDWPNQHLAPGSGAYHGSEVALVFGSAAYYTGIEDTPEEAALSRTMRHAWAEFARDPQNGLSKLGWPVYDETKPTLIRLGYQNKSIISFDTNKQYDSTCDTMEALSKGGLPWMQTGGFGPPWLRGGGPPWMQAAGQAAGSSPSQVTGPPPGVGPPWLRGEGGSSWAKGGGHGPPWLRGQGAPTPTSSAKGRGGAPAAGATKGKSGTKPTGRAGSKSPFQ